MFNNNIKIAHVLELHEHGNDVKARLLALKGAQQPGNNP